MKLFHYSKDPFELEVITDYPQKGDMKPNGFWISIENKQKDFHDWYDWCKSEEFYLEGLKYRYSIEINKDARILEVITHDDMAEFQKRYGMTEYRIDWKLVAESYQAIFIYPYKWELRLQDGFSWYYPWDCSSACVWNLDIIKEIKLDKEYKYNGTT